MSRTLVGGRGSAYSRAGSAAIVKTTCSDCSRTVLLVPVGEGRVAVDPEHIAVVPRRGGERMVAHRVHGDLCQQYQHEADVAARKKRWGTPPPRAAFWRVVDNTRSTAPTKRDTAKSGRKASTGTATTKRGARTKGL